MSFCFSEVTADLSVLFFQVHYMFSTYPWIHSSIFLCLSSLRLWALLKPISAATLWTGCQSITRLSSYISEEMNLFHLLRWCFWLSFFQWLYFFFLFHCKAFLLKLYFRNKTLYWKKSVCVCVFFFVHKHIIRSRVTKLSAPADFYLHQILLYDASHCLLT